MLEVSAALAPGAAAMIWYFGAGIALNMIVAAAAAIAAEAIILRVRHVPVARISDGSALLTGLLIGLCLPPMIELWIPALGAVFAITLGKHLYGGLGHNPFNPAMVGYAILIVSFPLAMSLWPAPGHATDMVETLIFKLGMQTADGIAMATPLDAFKFRGSQTVGEFWQASPVMGDWGGHGWLWINLGFLAGGGWLMYRGLCDRVMPAVMLATMTVLAAIFYDSGSSDSLGSPLFHLLAGSTMLAAFFIITDPVSSPNGLHARIVYAIGIGGIIFLIRGIGAYPDGIAFAVLLMNVATPFLDQYRWRLA